jgi:hypothetical protein
MEKLFTILTLLALASPAPARAVEWMGMIGYNINQVATPHSRFVDKDNGIGYGFLGRLEVGRGRLESGFLYSKASITSREGSADAVINGTYWIFPLLYRYTFLEPFFSVAAGIDYAAVGSRSATINGSPISGVSSGFRGHWGAQIGLEAEQDLGENLSAVLDVRYRAGLADAIAFGGEGTKINFWWLALGLQKRFDP